LRAFSFIPSLSDLILLFSSRDYILFDSINATFAPSTSSLLFSPYLTFSSHFYKPHITMSGKLDQALDDITQAQRRSARRRSNQRRSTGRPTAAAPIGGIQKNTKPARGSGAKPAPAKAAPTNSDSKIIVSNLVSFAQDSALMTFY
jgi:THO complex subunit 4